MSELANPGVIAAGAAIAAVLVSYLLISVVKGLIHTVRVVRESRVQANTDEAVIDTAAGPRADRVEQAPADRADSAPSNEEESSSEESSAA